MVWIQSTPKLFATVYITAVTVTVQHTSLFIDANHTGHISPTFCYVIPQVYSLYLHLTPLNFTHTYGILYYAIIQNTDSWRRPCPLPQQCGRCTHRSACHSCETIRTLMLVKQRLRLSHLAIDKALWVISFKVV
jgi:hypothetical protein